MDKHSARAPRIHTDEPLAAGATVALAPEQGHYLAGVLRLKPGDPLRLFNGRDGEWLAFLGTVTKKSITAQCERLVAEAALPPDIDLVFAPLKHARLDYLVQKATELGVRRLRPVLTRRTVAERVNLQRMRANAVEAAEQCNLVAVPEVLDPVKLEAALAAWPPERALIFCDESARGGDPLAALRALALPAAVLVGPEGGFEDGERAAILGLPQATAISLGPRILRADTAATAALTLAQATLGDWPRNL
jgi:16S rRNA (uracil1498-N3)-methyltransferase